jgi:hypothetical protein
MAVPLLLTVCAVLIVAGCLLLPARRSGEMHILPGNGWTHDGWTNNGTFGPRSTWIRTEYGLRNAWLVRDHAVGGTRTFTKIATFDFLVYLACTTVAGALTFLVTRCAFRRAANVA